MSTKYFFNWKKRQSFLANLNIHFKKDESNKMQELIKHEKELL